MKKERIEAIREGNSVTQMRKQSIIEYIQAYREEKSFSPTVREIAAGIGYSESSFGNVALWVRQLIAEGFLEKLPVSQRGLIPAKHPPRPYYYLPNPVLKSMFERKRKGGKTAKKKALQGAKKAVE